MVKKALFFTFLLFIAYALFISKIKPFWSISRHQQQDNQVKAEKFVYASKPIQRVLVGSSLSCRLDSLPGVYNLAFGGQSLFDGLAIILHQARPLSTVYVEINFVDRDEDANFTQGVNSPILTPLKRAFLSMRADKQPLSIVGERIQNVLTPMLSTPAPSLGAVATSSATGEDLFEKLLTEQVKQYGQVPNALALQQRFTKLENNVLQLTKRGVKVVFYEMPIDYHLCDSPKANAIRTTFQQHFSPAVYRYIKMPACGAYQTTDGVHLNKESAAKYSQIFKQLL